MTRKGVHPYEYMDSFERFQQPQLPLKGALYSSLAEVDISEADYTHAQRVFNHFDMTDLEDYHNFYILIDVLLLVDVFENFRDVCLQHYGLDPAHNYTSPCLSCSYNDGHEHLFIEEGIRGGVTMISQRPWKITTLANAIAI